MGPCFLTIPYIFRKQIITKTRKKRGKKREIGRLKSVL